MTETELGISIECKRRNGKITLHMWRTDPISGYDYRCQLTTENANKLIEEIQNSLTSVEGDKPNALAH